jgi:hypothetical protein
MLLSEIPFGSFISYSPHGSTPEALTSQRLTRLLKRDQIVSDPPRLMSRVMADSLAAAISEMPFRDFLGPDAFLVPVPPSSLLMKGGLWVPQRIAIALLGVGLGREVAELLERRRPVRKAAYCRPEERPKAKENYATLGVWRPLSSPERIVLIDDVITRGAALLGAASSLAEVLPESEIFGFAMIRTVSNPGEFISIDDPCMGVIRLRDGETYRCP